MCGIEATTHLLDELKKAAKRDKLDTPEGDPEGAGRRPARNPAAA
jgi:hypothetical protein